KVVDEEVPLGPLFRKLLPRAAEAPRKRRPRNQPFDAIAVEPARTFKIIAGRARYPHMPRLAMCRPSYRHAARDQSHAHTRTDGDIAMARKPLRCAPALLGKGSADDVGLYSERPVVAGSKAPREVDSRPPELGGRADRSVVGAQRIKLERTKG